jgi:hypothetical protein
MDLSVVMEDATPGELAVAVYDRQISAVKRQIADEAAAAEKIRSDYDLQIAAVKKRDASTVDADFNKLTAAVRKAYDERIQAVLQPVTRF